VAKKVFIALLAFYQRLVSPAFPPRCRFYPSCSHYAKEAIEKYGALKGGFFAIRRVLRCHPLHPGGVDPVP
jgi:putative membrane protein insertion efficiency factor